MEGIAQNIKCPTLITHGGHDIRMSVEGAKRLFNEIGAKDKTLKIYDDPALGGTIHCSHDCWAHNVPFMLDWLEERHWNLCELAEKGQRITSAAAPIRRDRIAEYATAVQLSNPLQPAHVRPEHFRDHYAAVFLLIILQYGDERATDG